MTQALTKNSLRHSRYFLHYKRAKFLPAVAIHRGNFCKKKFAVRYLDPRTSRWMSADPAMYQGDYLPSAPVNDEARKRNGNLPGQGGIYNYINLHVFNYANNNPVKYVDPNGREPVDYNFKYFTRGAEYHDFLSIYLKDPELYKHLKTIDIFVLQVEQVHGYRITSDYGSRANPITGSGTQKHRGRDIAVTAPLSKEIPIFAPFDGTVVEIAIDDRIYGNAVVIQNLQGDKSVISMSAHLKSVNVEVGDKVYKGSTKSE